MAAGPACVSTVARGESQTRPRVSVVLATHDRATRLECLIQALRRQTLVPDSFEILVVDDASRDRTSALLDVEAAHGEVSLTVITRRRSAGPAVARNEGWRAARAPIVAFTDDDCEPSAEWLAEGLRACEEHPGAIVQGRTRPLPREAHRLGPFSRTMEIDRVGPFFETCNVFYPRDLLERLDGFDERFTAPGGEDTDLAWRAVERGVPTVFAERAVVHHAVEDLGPRGHLRVALRWTDAMAMFRHQGLRDEVLTRDVFWKHSHALLLRAMLGVLVVAARVPARVPAGLALLLPYLRHLVARCRQAHASPALMPYFALHDLLETYATVRGGLRHRVLVV